MLGSSRIVQLTEKKSMEYGKLGVGSKLKKKSLRSHMVFFRWVSSLKNKLAIVGRNRPALYWSFIAAQMVGAIPVPIYNDAVGDEISYVLEHCGAKFAIVGDQEQCDKLLDIKDKLPDLTEIVYLDPKGLRKYDHSHLHAYKDVQISGREKAASQSATLQDRLAIQTQDTVCVMLYTSGTTGKPKGVVLTYKNVLSASKAASNFDN